MRTERTKREREAICNDQKRRKTFPPGGGRLERETHREASLKEGIFSGYEEEEKTRHKRQSSEARQNEEKAGNWGTGPKKDPTERQLPKKAERRTLR